MNLEGDKEEFTQTASLRIEELKTDGLKRNKVYIDPLIMKKLNLKKRGFIELIGNKKTVAVVYASKSRDKGLGIIRMEIGFRRNTGKNVGDMIEIRKCIAAPAKEIELLPVKIDIFSHYRKYDKTLKINKIRRDISNNPVTLYDKVDLSIIVSLTQHKFIVASLLPEEICYVDMDTKVTLLDGSIKDFDEKAIKTYESVLKLDPTDYDVWISLGEVHRKTKDYEKAKEAYYHSTQISPNEFYGWAVLSRLYNNTGEYDKSIEASEKGLKLISKMLTPLMLTPRSKTAQIKQDHRILTNLGYAYKQKGNMEKAIEFYNKALTLSPNYKEALNELGLIYFEKGEPIKSIAYFKKSMSVNENEALQSYFLFNILFKEFSNVDEGFKNSDYFKNDFNSQNFKAWHHLARNYYGIKHSEKALHASEQSLKINPNSEEALKLHESIQNMKRDE